MHWHWRWGDPGRRFCWTDDILLGPNIKVRVFQSPRRANVPWREVKNNSWVLGGGLFGWTVLFAVFLSCPCFSFHVYNNAVINSLLLFTVSHNTQSQTSRGRELSSGQDKIDNLVREGLCCVWLEREEIRLSWDTYICLRRGTWHHR